MKELLIASVIVIIILILLIIIVIQNNTIKKIKNEHLKLTHEMESFSSNKKRLRRLGRSRR